MNSPIIERARADMVGMQTERQRAIAAELGISFSGLRRILAGGSCTVRTLGKIAKRYGTEAERQLLGLIDRRASPDAEAPAADESRQQAAAPASATKRRQMRG